MRERKITFGEMRSGDRPTGIGGMPTEHDAAISRSGFLPH
jgi:hypothetical protein